MKILGYNIELSRSGINIEAPPLGISPEVIDVQNLSPFDPFASIGASVFDGNKFFGGLGHPDIVWTDFWALRLWSTKLFQENLYARGLIRRLITNEINTGLSLEATPNIDILGRDDDFRNEWSENVENRFQIWADNPQLCDHRKRNTFGALQRIARIEALVTGDVLVVLRQSQRTKLPAVQLIPGNKIQTPIGQAPRQGNKIIQGVEIDKNGVQVAYWVLQDGIEATFKRLPARGGRSGRRVAWLIYGTDKRFDGVRGEPILSLVLQSIKEIDRYRDSAQRKALINSILAMFIEKGEDKQGTRPVSGGAVRKGTADLSSEDGTPRKFTMTGQIPGLVLEELQTGEKPHAFDTTGTDINFPQFEAAILGSIAWANEIPPEVLTLAFQNNYSASRGAVNEFKMYLDKSRAERADEFDKPIYIEWLLSEVLVGKIEASGLLEAWRDPLQYDIFGAWTASDWAGAIKPSVDLKKEVQAYKEMIDGGLITRARATRELTGMKYSKVSAQLVKENEELAKARRPLAELEAETGVKILDKGDTFDSIVEEATGNVLELVKEEAE